MSTATRSPFFTVQSLGEYLGLSRSAVKRLLRDGDLPSYKLGGARRIDARDVDNYLAAHKQKRAA